MHVVIFRSTRTVDGDSLYAEWAQRTEEAVITIEGYVSHFSFWDKRTRKGVTTAYFESEEAITRWRDHEVHVTARELGHSHFYLDYTLEIARVERAYDWTRESGEQHG